ncbi:hypothetical protein [Nocardioides abyssi]|uniref:Uncharacterized protein n=1 Tax=Nocardioides abyssi TaxID=3058370 RepID=A0ABT8ERP6_9ACTN|nr:hypothetical protein [Nocardioides abyssi]MDN4160828.1 hypothetical protein [Nocardioides abyssi]
MTTATRALVLRTLTTADLLLSVAGLTLAWVWAADAWDSESSTAGIGVLFAFLLGVPMLVALLLTGLALLLRHKPVPAMALAGVAAGVLGAVAFAMVSMFLPF